MRNTTQEKFIEEEVRPVARKRLERSLILDEIVRREKIEVDNTALDSEFNNTVSELQMQGMDLGRIRGGRQAQQRVAEAVAMESASRLLARRALDVLKSIATGEYTPRASDPKATEGRAKTPKGKKKAASKGPGKSGSSSSSKKPASKKSAKKSA